MAAAAYRLDPLALAETQWGVLKLIVRGVWYEADAY